MRTRAFASFALVLLPACALIDAAGGGDSSNPSTCVEGQPCFGFEEIFAGPQDVVDLAIADIDGDTSLDIVFVGNLDAQHQLVILSGDGVGFFHSSYYSTPLPARPRDLLVFDLMDGGLADIVVLCEDGSLTRMTGNPADGAGVTVLPGPAYASSDARWLVLMDANGDGGPEVVVVSTTGVEVFDPRLGVLTPFWSLESTEIVGATGGAFWLEETPRLALARGDAYVQVLSYDVASASWFDRDLIWIQDMARGPVTAGDLDGDFTDELIVPIACPGGCQTFGRIYSPSNGAWSDLGFAEPFVPAQLLVAQVDVDSSRDILALNSAGHFLNPPSAVLARNSGGQFPTIPLAAGEQPRVAAVGDVNGDLHPDIAVTDGTRIFLLPGVPH